MRFDHAALRRPAYWLALSITFVALPVLAACGSGAQLEPSTPNTSAGAQVAPTTTAASESASAAAPTDERLINLAIANRETTTTREDLRVTQGETVRLIFTTDEPGEIHLHGYDLTAEVSPAHPGELVFEATTAGAFGINFHVLGADAVHSGTATVVSETPVSVAITAEPDAHGGVDVQIATEGFQFAPDSVDQPHTPGAGHAHIYVDGVKLGRVFESDYHIDPLSPGQHEVRVSLNTNDHSELVYDGTKAESTVTVTVPDVGQAVAHSEHQGASETESHDGHDHGEKTIVAEVHLGNLEVYP